MEPASETKAVRCAYCENPSGGEPSEDVPATGIYWDMPSDSPVAVCDDHQPTGEPGPTRYVTEEQFRACEETARKAGLPNRTEATFPDDLDLDQDLPYDPTLRCADCHYTGEERPHSCYCPACGAPVCTGCGESGEKSTVTPEMLWVQCRADYDRIVAVETR